MANVIWYVLLSLNSIILFFVSWKLFLILIPILICFFSLNYLTENNCINSSINSNVYVKKKIASGVIVNYKLTKIYVPTYENLSIDDLISLKSSSVKKINTKSSFERYLKSERVDYIAENPVINILGNKNSFRKKINDYLIRGPAYYSRYVPLILLGIKNSKNEIIINKLKNISIIHLFTISGFHINILLMLMHKILNKCKIKNKYIYMLCLVFLFPYILLMGMPIAATRALVFACIHSFNKYFLNRKFHSLNLLAFTMILFFIFNPYCIFSFSFIFTYILNYGIMFVSLLKNKKNKKLKIYLIAWLFSSLINISINNEINFLAILSTLFFGPIISFSYIITFLFFWLKPVIDNYYFFVDIIINIFQYINITFNIYLDINLIIVSITFLFSILIILIDKPLFEYIHFSSNTKKQIYWWLNNNFYSE